MWKRRKLKYREGCFTFTLIFLRPRHCMKSLLSSFQIINATLCTAHKANHNLNHHRQKLRFSLQKPEKWGCWWINPHLIRFCLELVKIVILILLGVYRKGGRVFLGITGGSKLCTNVYISLHNLTLVTRVL